MSMLDWEFKARTQTDVPTMESDKTTIIEMACNKDVGMVPRQNLLTDIY